MIDKTGWYFFFEGTWLPLKMGSFPTKAVGHKFFDHGNLIIEAYKVRHQDEGEEIIYLDNI